MLFPKRLWPGIADGSVTLAFRRWERPRARAGARHRTPAGVVEIDSIKAVDPARITDAAARRAGAADADEIRTILARRAGTHYRIAFHFVGPIRGSSSAPPTACPTRPGPTWRPSSTGSTGRPSAAPWTVATLRLIGDRPEVAAADLAAAVGRERLPFKADVRRLKELGLTESLRPGYRLSPRGAGLLDLPQPKSDALAVRARSISGEGMIPSPTTTSAAASETPALSSKPADGRAAGTAASRSKSANGTRR